MASLGTGVNGYKFTAVYGLNPGFGVFSVSSKRSRPGRNPNGEPIEITAREMVTFQASPLLLEKK
ncbi:HU family DNA-binding protein [Candidatus Magnetaquiglobus chichijimensis]|uniref:HU family DNA-binding protein n=1 Tax=Candidatus Magnetaquiglobus chichijimensis TaxID=3141448 RepID=UPI003B973D31